jgi:hypothetical protein
MKKGTLLLHVFAQQLWNLSHTAICKNIILHTKRISPRIPMV